MEHDIKLCGIALVGAGVVLAATSRFLRPSRLLAVGMTGLPGQRDRIGITTTESLLRGGVRGYGVGVQVVHGDGVDFLVAG